jgi:cytochrome c-type biogenesis protein CcmH
MSATPLFWIFAILLIALALALVLPSLLRLRADVPSAATSARSANLSILRDQLAQLDAEFAAGTIDAAQQAQARAEIERRALEEESTPESAAVAAPSTRTAIGVALGIPLLALGMYGFLGNLQALQPQSIVAPAEGEVTQAQIEAMVSKLAQRLENPPPGEPADPQAWEMLARSYAAMQRFPEASKAYTRATELAPNNAQLLADHADVLAMMQGQSVVGEPSKLIEQALKLDPKNLKALALAGSGAFERKDFAAATRYWTQARALAPAGSEFASGLERSLEEVPISRKPGQQVSDPGCQCRCQHSGHRQPRSRVGGQG